MKKISFERFDNFRTTILLAAIMVVLPPFVTHGFDITKVLQTNTFILTHSVRDGFSDQFPFTSLAALIVYAGVFFFGKKFGHAFSLIASLSYIASSFLQNISVSDPYGFAINLSTLSLTLFVAGAWLYEMRTNRNDFTTPPPHWRLAVLLPIALLALWQPVNPATKALDFNPAYFLTSGAPLTFCMTTIAVLAVMLAYYPHVNRTTLRITSVAGLLIGIGNIWLEFIYQPSLFWVGILHIPLLVLSAVGIFILIRSDSKNAG